MTMKFERSKEWWLGKARAEQDAFVGAGLLACDPAPEQAHNAAAGAGMNNKIPAPVPRRSGHARRVMVRKTDYAETLDDFPTTPWVVRALVKYVLPKNVVSAPSAWTFLDPAAGRGHVVRTLSETFCTVRGSDIHDYGSGYPVTDYVDPRACYDEHHFMVTNPPFKFASEFIDRGLREAGVGVAVIMRTIALEGGARYDRFYGVRPPSIVAVLSKRMPATHGRVVRKSRSNMSHSWFYWDLRHPAGPGETRVVWIPPGVQRELERDEDYDE